MQLFKSIIGAVVGSCVGSTVAAVLGTQLHPSTKIEKLTFAVGSFVISGMIADKASDYINDQIEEAIKEIKELSDGHEDEVE